MKPSKEKIKECKAKISEIFTEHHGKDIGNLIDRINSFIIGTTNFRRMKISKKIFEDIDEHVWKCTYDIYIDNILIKERNGLEISTSKRTSLKGVDTVIYLLIQMSLKDKYIRLRKYELNMLK